MCFSRAVGSHHRASTGCLFAVSRKQCSLQAVAPVSGSFHMNRYHHHHLGRSQLCMEPEYQREMCCGCPSRNVLLSQQLTNEEFTVVTQAGPAVSYARGLENTKFFVFISLRVWPLLPLVSSP